MKEEQTFALLMRLPGVFRVKAVKSQGNVKYFNVTYVFRKMRFDDGTLFALIKIWPFCNVQANSLNGSIAIEFLVRPEEADSFRIKVGGILTRLLNSMNRENREEYTVLVAEFDAPVSAECSEEMRAVIRSSDKIEWFGRSAVVTLARCQNVQAVEERLVTVAAKYGLKVKLAVLPPEAGHGKGLGAAVAL